MSLTQRRRDAEGKLKDADARAGLREWVNKAIRHFINARSEVGRRRLAAPQARESDQPTPNVQRPTFQREAKEERKKI